MSQSTAGKVAVCYPSGDTVHADFTLSLVSLCLMSQGAGIEINVINTKSSIVAIARNNAVDLAQQWQADHLLFIDSDMVFPMDALVRLLGHKKTIVGATYCKRVEPYNLLGRLRTAQPRTTDETLTEMDHLPTGFLLIDMRVFDSLSKPYFRFETDESTGEVRGEDYVFCERAAWAGHRIWCDVPLSYLVGHIGQKVHRFTGGALNAPHPD